MCEKMSAKCQDMEQKLKDTQHENKKLFAKFNTSADQVITQQSLMDDDEKLLYYTGLPSYCSVRFSC